MPPRACHSFLYVLIYSFYFFHINRGKSHHDHDPHIVFLYILYCSSSSERNTKVTNKRNTNDPNSNAMITVRVATLLRTIVTTNTTDMERRELSERMAVFSLSVVGF